MITQRYRKEQKLAQHLITPNQNDFMFKPIKKKIFSDNTQLILISHVYKNYNSFNFNLLYRY